MDGWRTAGSGFGAPRSVSQLKRRATELGVEVPCHAEKSELNDLIEQAESQQRQQFCSSAPMRSVAELKARLRELGLEVPTTICEKQELVDLVSEAEKMYAKRVRSPQRSHNPGPVSPSPKVRYRNAAGNIPHPWYQMESRSRPGHFYFVNADTGERKWEMPKANNMPPPPPPPRDRDFTQAYRHVPADFVPPAPVGQLASGSAMPFSPLQGSRASPNGLGRGGLGGSTAVPPGMPPLPAHGGLGGCSPVPHGMPPLPTEGDAAAAASAVSASQNYAARGAPASQPPAAAQPEPAALPPLAAAPSEPASQQPRTSVRPQPAALEAAIESAPLQAPVAAAAASSDEDVFGQTNPVAEAIKEAGDTLLADSDQQDDCARHDYRDQGFIERGPPLAPAGERRWSRHGSMLCQRQGDSGGVLALSLTVHEEEPWDPETTLSPNPGGAVKGSQFTWVRGKMLGRGSLGRVFKALDCNSGKTLAVKEVPIDLNNESDRKYIEDLQNEVAIMSYLKHPHIVRYLGHDFMDNSLYMYIEHMPGGSLTQALQQFGPFDECLVASYSKQILAGLEYMHTRDPPVVHRDIKGPNILVGADCRVKLADFGCAKRTQETMTHTMRGSIHWMAPEVIAHERYGRAADIWSFGCVAIEMGTATVPWGKLDNQMAAVIKIGMSEETPPLPEGLSPAGNEFISSCVQRDASLRPTANALLRHELVLPVSLPAADGDGDDDG